MIVIYRNTYAVTVILGDGCGVELVELLLELERARLLPHLRVDAREGEVERRRVGHVVYEDLRLAGLTGVEMYGNSN